MPQLDGLRAWAVSMVIYTHLVGPRHWFLGIYWGEQGVNLFFVLSGFLITRLLLEYRERIDHGSCGLGRALLSFYGRRALRLVPALFAALALLLVLDVPEARPGIFWHASYLSNFYFGLRGNLGGFAAHLWSLAVEEQFYIVWSLVVLVCPLRKLRVIAVVALAIAPAFRILLRLLSVDIVWDWVMVPSCFDRFSCGSLLALLPHPAASGTARARFLRGAGASGLVAWIVLRAVPSSEGTGFLAQHLLAPVADGLVFLYLVGRAECGFQGPLGFALSNRLVRFVGKISYGLYLFHGFVPSLLARLARTFALSASPPPAMLVVAATFALAVISWHLIEHPSSRLKERLFPLAPSS